MGLLCSGGKPGLAPAGELLFFASPKKSNQKKGEPRPCRFAVPCATRSVRGRAKLASLKQRPPLSERCSVAQHVLMAVLNTPARPLRELRPNGSLFAPRELRPNGSLASLTSRGLGCLIPLPSLLARARHAVPLHQTPSFLTPHFSSWATTRVSPTPSLLRPHSYDLTPQASSLTQR